MFEKVKASKRPEPVPAHREKQLTDLSWEADVVLNARKSKTIAWRVAGAAVAVGLAQAAALVMLVPLHSVVPMVVMVDKLTGESQVVPSAQEYVTTSSLSDKHWIQSFLIARERYVYRFIQFDYDTVKRLAGNQTWSNYTPLFEGSESLDKKLRDDVEIIPTVLSITLNGSGMATVRYELRTKDYRTTAPPVVTRRVATLRYEYQSRNLTVEKDAIANPLGFTVTAYQTDPELGGEAKEVKR